MKKRIKLMKKYFKKKQGHESKHALEFIEADIDAALLRANALIGVDEEVLSEPLIISSPDSLSRDSKVKYRITINKDGNRIDYDQALITSIYLSNESLFYHETKVDHITGLVSYDIAGELNLFDILHIETIIEYEQLMNYKTYKVFLKLNLVDGNDLAFFLRQQFIYDGVEEEGILTEDESYIIKTIKQAVRLSK